jgi:glycosyltransferase involved in cell wall biosynthesis
MACGVPVISTSGGALPEVIGDAGILVPPGDANALATAIKQLLNNKRLQLQLGEAGRRRVESEFSWEQAAKKTLEVYQELL